MLGKVKLILLRLLSSRMWASLSAAAAAAAASPAGSRLTL